MRLYVTVESFDLEGSFLVCRCIFRMVRSYQGHRVKVKVTETQTVSVYAVREWSVIGWKAILLSWWLRVIEGSNKSPALYLKCVFTVKFLNDHMRDKSLICYKCLSVSGAELWRVAWEEYSRGAANEGVDQAVLSLCTKMLLYAWSASAHIHDLFLALLHAKDQLVNSTVQHQRVRANNLHTYWTLWKCHLKTVLFRRCFGSNVSF